LQLKKKGLFLLIAFIKSGSIPFKGAVGGHLIKSAAFLFWPCLARQMPLMT
jgi:hypothetical protein